MMMTSRSLSSSSSVPRRLSLTVQSLSRLLDSERISSEQVTSFCHSLAVVGDDVWDLNAFSRICPLDCIIEQSKESDTRRRLHGQPMSVWDGLPVSFKANIAFKSMALTAGSKILGELPKTTKQTTTTTATTTTAAAVDSSSPACGYDADVVRILTEENGAICIGITNMDEFGMGSLGTHLVPDDEQNRRSTQNPLPLLEYLHWEDVLVGSKDGRSQPTTFESEEEFLEKVISLPYDAIVEVHQLALERRALVLEQATNPDQNDLVGENNNNNNNNSNCSYYRYSAGGSSCGSACSVAHGSSVISLGTDTGGSIRLPAAWCGIVGLKPSYGLLSRFGIVSYASSFDTVGILANTVDCATTALDTLAQRSGDGSTTSRDPTSSFYSFDNTNDSSDEQNLSSMGSPAISAAQIFANEEEQNKPLQGRRVGIPASFVYEECEGEVMKNWSKSAEWLEQNGAEIVEIPSSDLSLDLVQLALSSYYVLVSAEASSNLSRYDGFRYGVAVDEQDRDKMLLLNDRYSDLTPLELQYAANRSHGFGAEVSRRILCGTSVLSSDRFHSHYEAAARIRAALAEEMNDLLDGKIDLLLLPTVASTIPQRIDPGSQIDNTAVLATDVLTVPASLAGLPAMSVPVPSEDNQPFCTGIQLIGPRLREDVILTAAKILEFMDRDLASQ